MSLKKIYDDRNKREKAKKEADEKIKDKEKSTEQLLSTQNKLKSFINNHTNNHKTIALYLKILKHTNNLGSDKKLRKILSRKQL